MDESFSVGNLSRFFKFLCIYLLLVEQPNFFHSYSVEGSKDLLGSLPDVSGIFRVVGIGEGGKHWWANERRSFVINYNGGFPSFYM